MTTAFSAAIEIFTSMWFEISFAVFFALGYIVMCFEKHYARKLSRKKRFSVQSKLQKTIEASVAGGQGSVALKSWRSAKNLEPTPMDSLKLIVQVLLDEEPGVVVQEISEHISRHSPILGNSKIFTAVLDVVAKAGNFSLMEELAEKFQSHLHIDPTGPTYEVLLAGYAHAGNLGKISEVKYAMQHAGYKLTVRGHSLIIKGLLKNELVDAAFHQMQNMQEQGLFVPTFALAHLFRIAGISGDMASLFVKAYPEEGPRLPLPSEVVGVVMEDCLKRDHIEMAFQLEEMARTCQTPLLASAYDPLLKLCITHADVRVLTIFARMQNDGVRITDSFCVGLLARCAESKFLRFAEHIVQFVRNRNGMTLVMYSALMKVYAFCGLYGNACDLYSRMREDGLEPDSVMYGCLMKFSVECGRTDLSQELFEKAPSLDMQNYMSLMRAAGRDRDVDRAFKILDKLKIAGQADKALQADKAAYNCVLDACVSAGEMDRARELLEQMKQLCSVDIIAYNTLLKGYRATGDLHGAKALFTEIENLGLRPNDVSYNCLINVAVSKGAFKEAWAIIDTMERNGVCVDRYTISIMMKSVKKVSNPSDVCQALALLDRKGIDVCSDEVLLNSVLEVCSKNHLLDRMSTIMEDLSRSRLHPSVHTYATIIKSCSGLKRLDTCWKFWKEMTELRALDPNEVVLGCMLDALVCNGSVDDAMDLFKKWNEKIRPNTIIYSILIKGFSNSHRASEAMELWDEMRSAGLQLNTATYNAIIDCQARAGDVDMVSQLVAGMKKDGCAPDAITYSTSVKAWCIQGQFDKALDVLRTMQANSMAKDSVVYNTLLDGCAQHRRIDVAGVVLKDMHTYNIRPSNFTLGILVKMYGRCHQLDKAFEVVQDYAKRYGIIANDKVNTSLIQACMNENDPDRAMQIFSDLKTTSDAKLFGMVISGLVRHRRLEQAAQLVDEACRVIRSDGVTKQVEKDMENLLAGDKVEHLFCAISQQAHLKRLVAPLLEKMRANGVQVSSKLLHYAVDNQKFDDDQLSKASCNKPSRQQRPWNVHKGV